MRRPKGFTIYPPPDLKGELVSIATEEGRSTNQQALRFIRAGIKRFKRRHQLAGSR